MWRLNTVGFSSDDFFFQAASAEGHFDDVCDALQCKFLIHGINVDSCMLIR